jgi:hypothetical protein
MNDTLLSLIIGTVLVAIFAFGYHLSNKEFDSWKKQAIEANVAYYSVDSQTGITTWNWRTNSTVIEK